ncbi:MAG: hypothetical protein KJ882_00045, partial [Proteobacteria bacterium]|nr:hypothetical protein [Pseudomonadota bacterium]
DIDRVATNKKVAYTTAAFVELRNIPPGKEFGLYLEDVHPYAPGKAKDYYMIKRKASEIKVYEDPEDPVIKRAYYKDNSGLRRLLVSADLDPASHKRPQQVNIIAVEGTLTPCNKDTGGDCGNLKGILYIDPGAGQIDTYYTAVSPGDKDKSLKDKQGLLPNYEKKMDYGRGAALTVSNNKDKGFSTVTNSDATQTITHKIRLNKQSELEPVKVEFKPTQTYNWEVK